MNDRDLDTVVEMCDGDTEERLQALGAVLEEHGPPLLECIKGMLHRRGITYNLDEMAKDILQQVAMELLQSASNEALLNVKSLRGYVYAAARWRTLQFLRDGAREAEHLTHPGTFWQVTERLLAQEGVDPIETAELEQALAECIEKLDGKKRQYVQLIADDFYDPPGPKEIAEIYGVSPESVRNRLCDARDDLENCLRGKGHSLPFRRKGATQ